MLPPRLRTRSASPARPDPVKEGRGRDTPERPSGPGVRTGAGLPDPLPAGSAGPLSLISAGAVSGVMLTLMVTCVALECLTTFVAPSLIAQASAESTGCGRTAVSAELTSLVIPA